MKQKRTIQKLGPAPRKELYPGDLKLDTPIAPQVYISNKFIKFMKRSLGPKFKFFPAFNKRLEDNAYSGKTLKDGIKAWLKLKEK